ncbi:hypothetical protein BXZ70DRAFT_1009561 [Cristinia sonorae]|uniref:Uncharacterized protein n=1 Tax=Cristinia sonorae TaxID=1940300 RepID=A0A8K0UK94_9AGAR|nr:hypothetical protein BXZ70DRAFT_1009561 [Cristinia sonorae]
MVASHNTRKKTKYTYAERVVGALSQIQREHRKHAVHIATLRAQIRKNAQESKDKLGPQWSNWVSRAVTKLEQQGVLEDSGANNLTFTAEAKKALTSARRESAGLPTLSQAGVATFEDLVWKQVAQADFTRGTKRPRRRSSAVQPRYVDDDEDDAPSASISTRKKARRSSGKALSKMTKAELQAALHDAQTSSSRALPAEAVRLQQELEEARRQLAEAQEQLSSPARASQFGTSSPHTPLPRSRGAPTTAAKSLPRRGPLFSMTRTESGSLINQYSKQPTPAPSTPGPHDFDMDHESSPMHHDHGDAFAAHGLATPSSTRFRAQQDEEEDNNMDDVFGGGPLTPLRSPPEPEFDASAHEKRVEQLEAELREKLALLIAKDASLSSEQSRVQSLRQTVAELEAACVEKDAEIVGAKQLLDNAEALTATLRSDIEAQREQHVVQLADLQASLASYQAQLREETERATNAEAELASMKEDLVRMTQDRDRLINDYDGTMGILTNLRTERLDFQATIDDLTTRCNDTQEQRDQAQLLVSQLTEQVTSLRSELQSLNATQAQSLSEKDAAEKELADLRAHIATMESSLSMTSLELEQSRLAAAALDVQVNSLEEHRTSDAAALQTLREQATEFEAFIDQLCREISAATDREDALNAQILGHQARETELINSREETLRRVEALDAELTTSRTKLAELELTSDELTYRLQTKDDELTRLHADIQAKETARASLEFQLSSLQTEYAKLEKTVAENTEKTKVLQSDVASLRSTEAELRKALESEAAQRATDRVQLTEEIALLQVSLQKSEAEATAFADAAEEARRAHQVTTSLLEDTQARLESTRQALAVAETQVSSLARDIDTARTNATEAALEMEELRIAKAEGEKNVLELRQVFAGLRETQMKAWAEAENKMASTQHSAMPPRRESTRPITTQTAGAVALAGY